MKHNAIEIEDNGTNESHSLYAQGKVLALLREMTNVARFLCCRYIFVFERAGMLLRTRPFYLFSKK